MTDPNTIAEVKPPMPNTNLPQKVLGKDIYFAPRPALTAADETAFPTGSTGNYVQAAATSTLNNMRSRIDAIEAALIKLGLLRHP